MNPAISEQCCKPNDLKAPTQYAPILIFRTETMTIPIKVIILAAGKGTRMKSSKAKVLHEVFFAPMIHHVINTIVPLDAAETIVVTGHQREKVESSLAGFDVTTVVQENQLGTGHAVISCEDAIKGFHGTTLILCGDTPLIQSSTLLEMIDIHNREQADLTLLTTVLDDPTNYGRIVRSPEGNLLGIVEQKDCSVAEQKIQEINAGIYCVQTSFLFNALSKITQDNSQGELYLTDIVSIGVEEGRIIQTSVAKDPREVLGVNSRVELSEAHNELQRRRNTSIMLEGISIVQPESVQISPGVIIGRDTRIEPGVQLLGETVISGSCTIGQGAILKNCTLGHSVTVGPYCCLSDITIKNEETLSPHTTIQPQ